MEHSQPALQAPSTEFVPLFHHCSTRFGWGMEQCKPAPQAASAYFVPLFHQNTHSHVSREHIWTLWPARRRAMYRGRTRTQQPARRRATNGRARSIGCNAFHMIYYDTYDVGARFTSPLGPYRPAYREGQCDGVGARRACEPRPYIIWDGII